PSVSAERPTRKTIVVKTAVRNGELNDENTIASAVTIATSATVSTVDTTSTCRSPPAPEERSAIAQKSASDQGSTMNTRVCFARQRSAASTASKPPATPRVSATFTFDCT